MQERFRYLYILSKRYTHHTSSRFIQSNLTQRAAQLTLSSLLAAVPIITIVIGILGLTPALKDMQTQLFNFLSTHLTPGTTDTIFPYLIKFSQQAKNLPAAGIVTLFITALLLLNTFEGSVQSIWNIKKQRKIRDKLLTYWAILTLGPIIFAASLSLYGTLLSYEIRDIQASEPIKYLIDFGSYALYFFMLFTLNFLTPNTDVSLRIAAFASFIGSIGLFLLNTLFGSFAHFFSSYQVVYGAFAALPIFLIWLQSTWIIILASTCLCASIHHIKSLAFDQD
ncbi:YihY family inner membrane protein [Marinomonas spartinae]|uniref:YihY family inner membrane protein n=1 Tax=Marinomonas spartinae TaxID=1792290 RepID=UPI0018F15520|nr:YihY family inner membrane protein [Marinomonas spartinae]MBJ7553173.1 YihY family inner membrane protein [Marinomonas spartinae]